MQKSICLRRLIVVLAALAQTAGADEPPIDAALDAIGDRCAQQHGYDWRNPGALGDHELGEGEKAWRGCVYTAIRDEIIPGSAVPEEYERIIAQDQAFTRAIEAGTMTRGERSQENAEEKQALLARETAAAEEKRRQEDDMVDQMRQDQVQRIRQRAVENMLRGVSRTARPHY